MIPELWNDVTRAQKRRLKADALEFEILSTRTIEWLRNDREMSRLEAMVKVAGGEGRVAALDKFIRRYKSK